MRFILPVLFTLFSLPAAAQCVGKNLMQTMPADARAQLDAATASHPYPNGNLWRATKGASTIHVMGTFHLTDPRLDAYLEPLWPLIDTADLILLEATRETMEQLKTETLTNPSLLFIKEGPTLIDQMSAENWERLSAELSLRGIPGFMASKMQPWYAAMMLSIPPCAMAGLAAQNGVDHRILARAEIHNTPTRALEGFDVVYDLLGGGDPEAQLEGIRLALTSAKEGDALFTTMTTAYLSGAHRAIWELGRQQALYAQQESGVDGIKLFDEMEAKLLTDRNANWMPLILAAAQEAETLVVAVGAAHLSGENGVLYLLEKSGYVLTRVDGF